MTKMPEPVGCGYVVRWERGDTASLYETGRVQVLGVDVFTAEQLKQYGRDLLEEAAKKCDEIDKDSQSQWPQRIATIVRNMKEQIK